MFATPFNRFKPYLDSDELTPVLKYPCNICKMYKHDYWFEDIIHAMILSSKSPIIVFVGEPRSCKSWSSIILARDIFKTNFRVSDLPEDNQILWDFESVLNFYSNNTRSVGIMEELGIQQDKMLWYTVANSIFKYILETQGFRENTLFMNLPDETYIPNVLIPLIKVIVICSRSGNFAKATFWVKKDKYKPFAKLDYKKITTMIMDLDYFMKNNERLDLYLKEYWNQKLEIGRAHV